MTPQRSVPWTPEEDKLLTEAVATCEYRSIYLNLAELICNIDSRVIGGAKICWKDVARSVPGTFNLVSASLASIDG